jgi:hypothetical protein
MHRPAPEPLRIVTEYTTPGGIATRVFSDGGATMRVCLGQIRNRDDGLLAEMDSGGDPVPWESLAVKREAIEAVQRRGDLDPAVRDRLTRHIRRTPYYEG